MAPSGIARNLTVLVVDDQASSLLARQLAAPSVPLDYRFIGSWEQAQSLCARGGDMGGADILLIDVSFETDGGLDKMVSGGESILPAGPLLALPFIGKRSVMSCACYSAHIANPQLQSHPWFLMAMGLILARSVGIPSHLTALHSAHLSNGSGAKHLDAVIKALAQTGYTNQSAALSAGQTQYRRNLLHAIKEGSAVLANRNALTHALGELGVPESLDDLGNTLDTLSISLVGSNWRDCLNLRSLFADLLMPAHDWEVADAMDEIRDWLNGIPAPTPIEWAFKALDAQDQEETRPSIKEVLLKVAGPEASSYDLTEALRLCALFANVWAIHYGKGDRQPSRQSVLNRLADQLDINVYFGWFGERDKEESKRRHGGGAGRDAPSKNGTFARLRPLSRGADKYARCLLVPEVSALSQADQEAVAKYCAYERIEAHMRPVFPDLVGSAVRADGE